MSVFQNPDKYQKDKRGIPLSFVNHNPSKAKKKGQSALVVSFDERKRKDFVGGFHRRKLERRKKAAKEQAEIDRLAKIEARRLKRIEARQRIETDKLLNPFALDDDDNDNNNDNNNNDDDDGEDGDAENATTVDDEHNDDERPRRSIVDEADAIWNDGGDNASAVKSLKKRRQQQQNDDNDNDATDRDESTTKVKRYRGENVVATVVVEPVTSYRRDVHAIDAAIAKSLMASQRNDEKTALEQARDAERKKKLERAKLNTNKFNNNSTRVGGNSSASGGGGNRSGAKKAGRKIGKMNKRR